MTTSRRTILGAAGAGVAFPQIALGAGQQDAAQVVARLLAETEAGNAALMRGDIEGYNEVVRLADDFVLMSPFGGEPSRAAEYTPERIERMGRFFRDGTFAQEVVATYASPDMVALAVIERTTVEVGGLPRQDWALRVTLVYRRDGDDWVLAHRHADPLVGGLSLEEAAALAARKGMAEAG